MNAAAEMPRPSAIVLDLDGVLVDIHRDRALASPEDLAAIAERLPVAVVTSCPRRLALSVLERHGFAPYVGAVVGYEDGPGKPNPEPVWLALERLGLPGATAWMLGDNPGDVHAAKSAGITPLAIEPEGIGGERHAERLREAGALLLLPGLAELRAMLDGK